MSRKSILLRLVPAFSATAPSFALATGAQANPYALSAAPPYPSNYYAPQPQNALGGGLIEALVGEASGLHVRYAAPPPAHPYATQTRVAAYAPQPMDMQREMDPDYLRAEDANQNMWLPAKIADPRLSLEAEVPTPYHIEIWCEKSTINDVLKPLGEKYGLNIVTGLGEMSISACRDLIARVRENGDRPVRILYVSDFDPGGQSMPVATARKLEWFMRQGQSIRINVQEIIKRNKTVSSEVTEEILDYGDDFADLAAGGADACPMHQI